MHADTRPAARQTASRAVDWAGELGFLVGNAASFDAHLPWGALGARAGRGPGSRTMPVDADRTAGARRTGGAGVRVAAADAQGEVARIAGRTGRRAGAGRQADAVDADFSRGEALGSVGAELRLRRAQAVDALGAAARSRALRIGVAQRPEGPCLERTVRERRGAIAHGADVGEAGIERRSVGPGDRRVERSVFPRRGVRGVDHGPIDHRADDPRVVDWEDTDRDARRGAVLDRADVPRGATLGTAARA